MSPFISAIIATTQRSSLVSAAPFVLIVTAMLSVGSEYLFGVRLGWSPVAMVFGWVWLVLACRLLFFRIGFRSHEFVRDSIEIFLVGVALGLVVSIAKIAYYQELWTAFNLVAEPLRNGLASIVLLSLTLRIRAHGYG